MRPGLLDRIALALTAFTVLTTAASVASAAEPGPYPPATWEQVQDEETRWAQEGKVEAPTPPGVNRYDCTPTVPGAVPVVLLHGFAGDQYRAWGYLGPALANAGLCVYSFSYGGSDAMQGGGELKSGPITVPGITYTTISSRFDPIAGFQNLAAIPQPGVDNYVLQNVCPSGKAGHNGTVFSPTTAALVLNALDRSTVRPIPCQDDSTG